MDRISDSGSDDWGSTPHGRTIPATGRQPVAVSLKLSFKKMSDMIETALIVFFFLVILGMFVPDKDSPTSKRRRPKAPRRPGKTLPWFNANRRRQKERNNLKF